MKYLFHGLVLTLLLATHSPFLTHAQVSSGPGAGVGSGPGKAVGSTPGGGIALENPLGESATLTTLITAIIDIVLVFAIPIIVFFIILAGFKYVTARGNPGTIEEAHMALLYALIGGVLILGAKVLIEVLTGTIDAIRN